MSALDRAGAAGGITGVAEVTASALIERGPSVAITPNTAAGVAEVTASALIERTGTI